MDRQMHEKISSLEKRNYKWIFLFLLPSMIIFIMFYLNPIVTMFATSFCKWDGFNAPHYIGLENYVGMFTDSTFLISLKNLLLWSIIAGTLHVGIGVLVAIILFFKPRGWKFTRAVYMIPNVISAAAWALIYKFIFNDDFGVLNNIVRKFNPDFHVQWFFQSPYAFWAVTFTWLFYAVIVTLIVLNDLMAIPEELTEAAKVDGASGWNLVSRIYLPLCRNSIGTGLICSITSRIAMYEQIRLTTAGGPGDDTMNIPLILVNSINDMKYGYANALGVIMFILGILILLIVDKAFRMNDSIY